MVERIQEIQFLRNIGFLMTFKCQVQCPHCIIEAGPHRTEEISLEDAYDWIEQIAGYRNGYIQVLSLTGGEPFIDLRKLKLISEYADKRGLLVSAVTNAFWAVTENSANAVLEGLPALQMLQFSTDVYHQKSIPFRRIKNAVAAANHCRIPFTISVCTENEKDPEYRDILRELEQLTDPQTIFTAITFRAGRALEQFPECNYEKTSEPPISSCGAGGAPIVFPNGQVMACIGPIIAIKTQHPLALGSLRENTLAEILDSAEMNVLLHAIRLWGPKKIIQLLHEAGMGDKLPKEYIKDSVCHTCYELMANREILPALMELSQDRKFAEKVAYGRVYYLNEPQMVVKLNLV